MKHYIIGDVHGCGRELEGLLDEIQPRKDDKIISVGDILDRGLHCYRSFELLYSHEVLMGNHEHKLLKYLKGERQWIPPHYIYALNQIIDSGVSVQSLQTWLEKRPLMYSTPDFLVVHGGIYLDNPTKENADINCFYKKGKNYLSDGTLIFPNDYWWDVYAGEKLVIYGHLSDRSLKPRIRKNSIGIDTAAVHGNDLTAYCPEEDKFYTYSSGINWAAKLKSHLLNNNRDVVPAVKAHLSWIKPKKEPEPPKKKENLDIHRNKKTLGFPKL